MNEQTILKLADDVTFQSLGAEMETVILSLNSGTLYSCNQTTDAFLKALDGNRSFAATVDALLEEFDVARDALSSDLQDIAGQLVAEGLVEVVRA